MDINWTKNIKDEEEKERFVQNVLHSKLIFRRMKEILKEYEEDLDSKETNLKTYEVPNWAHRQAHCNGYRQALRQIDKLITLDPKEK
jgi:hypothetical protein